MRRHLRKWLCWRGRHGYEAFPDQINVGCCPYCGVIRRGDDGPFQYVAQNDESAP